MKYYGQYLQDKFLDENIFKDTKCGFFLEMGADNGINHSNTYFFEKNKEWRGVCIEPRETAFKELIQNRKCICENICIADKKETKKFLEIDGYAEQLSGLQDNFDEKHIERIDNDIKEHDNSSKKIIDIECITLQDIFEKHNVSTVDYFSLDIEGGEINILKSIDFSKVFIKVISVENNYHDKEIKRFLKRNNYKLIKKLGIDEIYVHQESELPNYTEPFNLSSCFRDIKQRLIKIVPKRIKKIIKKMKRND